MLLTHARTLALACLGLLPLPALTPTGEALSFTAAEGTELVRTATYTTEVTMVEMTMRVDGTDREMRLPAVAFVSDTSVVVRDRYGSPDAAGPTSLWRRFEELDWLQSIDVEGEVQDTERSGELLGHEVVFERDGDGAVEVMFADDADGDPDWLEPLEEDMDLREVLPEGEVSAGDSWEVDPDLFWRMRFPGGLDLSRSPDRDSAEADPEARFRENTEGRVTATFRGTRDLAGRPVAVIGIELSLESEVEWTEEGERSGENLLSEAFEGEGELLWSLEGGHLAGLDLSGEMFIESEEDLDVAEDQDTVRREVTRRMEGSFEIEWTVEVD